MSPVSWEPYIVPLQRISKNGLMKTKTMPQDLEKFTQVKLLDGIISAMKKKKLSEASITAALPYIQTFARRINVSDDAAMLFSAFFLFRSKKLRNTALIPFSFCPVYLPKYPKRFRFLYRYMEVPVSHGSTKSEMPIPKRHCSIK